MKRIGRIIVFVLIIIGVLIVWQQYQAYQERKAARIERLKQQAEEVKVTVIEGWRMTEMADALEESDLFEADDFIDVQKSFDLAEYPLIKEHKPKSASLEGFLFPDTYRFNKHSTPEMVLGKMLDNFVLRLETLGVTSDTEKFIIPGYEQYPMNFYKVLTLASIIEQESGGKGPMSLAEERALVAGVFYNRLLAGQALESDATVNYATGKSSPGASAQDLQVNSPYNTYKYAGLPPGPICNPSLASIKAALQPQKTDYYYFLHKQPSGEAVFSRTFDEHRRQKLGQ